MKRLKVQLQPGLSPKINVPAAVAKLRTVASNARVNEGEEEGQYVNIGSKTADPAMIWAAIRRLLQAAPALASGLNSQKLCSGSRVS